MRATVRGSTGHMGFGGVLEEIEGDGYLSGGENSTLDSYVEFVVVGEAEKGLVCSHVVGVFAVCFPC